MAGCAGVSRRPTNANAIRAPTVGTSNAAVWRSPPAAALGRGSWRASRSMGAASWGPHGDPPTAHGLRPAANAAAPGLWRTTPARLAAAWHAAASSPAVAVTRRNQGWYSGRWRPCCCGCPGPCWQMRPQCSAAEWRLLLCLTPAAGSLSLTLVPILSPGHQLGREERLDFTKYLHKLVATQQKVQRGCAVQGGVQHEVVPQLAKDSSSDGNVISCIDWTSPMCP